MVEIVAPVPWRKRELSSVRGLPTASMKKELEELGSRMMEPEFLKDVVVQVGIAFEVITNTARDCKIDLIALTTHGKTGLKHMFMGNTADVSRGTHLARSSSCASANTSSPK